MKFDMEPEQKQQRLSSVSFFCPAYNDEENLPILVPRVDRFLRSITDKYEIIIVHDASPDKTGIVADSLAKQNNKVRVIHHSKNEGYGGALKSGFQSAKYDFVMYTDGDNQYDVNEFLPYLHLLEKNDVLAGYVTKKAASFRRVVQSFVYNLLVQVLFLVRVKDINCSMKIYKKRVLEGMKIKSTSAFIDAEMIIKAHKNGCKIAQFPVTHFAREHGLASGSRPSVVIDTLKEMLLFRFGILR